MTADDLVGVYRQVGEDIVSGAGALTYGEPRLSQIVYTADGYVTVVSTPDGRARVSETAPRVDLNGATPDERAAAADNVVCYAGRFAVKDGSVFHRIEMALNPNAVGTTVQRRVLIEGPDLTLSTEPDAQGGFRRIRWRRVEAL
jgi:hypothetical protein